MLPRTFGAVIMAPLRLALPPAFSVTELPPMTRVVVKLVSVPSALPRETLPLAVTSAFDAILAYPIATPTAALELLSLLCCSLVFLAACGLMALSASIKRSLPASWLPLTVTLESLPARWWTLGSGSCLPSR